MLGRSPTVVNFVSKHLIRDQMLLNTRGFILERGPTIVKTVAMLSIKGKALAYTRKFIVERNCTSVKGVRASSAAAPTWLSTSALP